MKRNNLILPILMFHIIVISSCKTSEIESKRHFIETANIDTTIKPGDNFYMYANGSWIKKAIIPSTESNLGSFLEVYNETQEKQRTILEDLGKKKYSAGSLEQKVGDFYTSGMDSITIEKLGYDPVRPTLQAIDGLKDTKDILRFIANEYTKGDNLLLAQGIRADQKNSAINIVNYYQAGLGLPDRDYYFKTDAATNAVATSYKNYIEKIFRLTGDDSATALNKMQAIYNLEKEIAGSHKTNVELRDPQANYHKMSVAEILKSMPVLEWNTLLSDLQIKTDSFNIGQPSYYTKLNDLLKTTSLDKWKTYFKFHVLDNYADALSSDFVNAKFDYYKALSGQQVIQPRWKRMIANTDANLGEAFGQLYVKRYFTDSAKRRMLDLVNNLQRAFATRITNLDWMSDSTKHVAIDKLNVFIKKIGYPDKWRDYSKVSISDNTYFKNLVSAAENEYQYQLSKVNKPVDKTEWAMTPPTINAYYNESFNEIVFPAGILQFPFFDLGADDAINYGGIGMAIGHEMTHGFDDQGAQFDKDGNLKNWWSKEDNEKFKAKTKLVENLYNSFTVLDTMHLNGALTLGENLADLGGINIAYDAFKLTEQGKSNDKIDGFTPDQRFFLSYAAIWRSKIKDEALRSRVNTNPHSPSIHRVNGPLMNFTPFYNAFNVKEGDKMYKPESERIKIW